MTTAATLDAVKAAWEGTETSPRDKDLAVALSDEFVRDHPDLFNGLRDKTLEECVETLEVFRNAGITEEEWKAQVWLFHRFEFQQIGGGATVKVREPNNGV